MASALWTAHPHCPAHLRDEVKARVRALPSAFLEEPTNSEVFDNVELYQERLQGFALSQGFTIVLISGSMKQAHPRFYFKYIYYGNSTRNIRNLEEHVQRNKKGDIITYYK